MEVTVPFSVGTVFPRVAQRALIFCFVGKKIGLEFFDVDLRWGVRMKKKADGLRLTEEGQKLVGVLLRTGIDHRVEPFLVGMSRPALTAGSQED